MIQLRSIILQQSIKGFYSCFKEHDLPSIIFLSKNGVYMPLPHLHVFKVNSNYAVCELKHSPSKKLKEL